MGGNFVISVILMKFIVAEIIYSCSSCPAHSPVFRKSSRLINNYPKLNIFEIITASFQCNLKFTFHSPIQPLTHYSFNDGAVQRLSSSISTWEENNYRYKQIKATSEVSVNITFLLLLLIKSFN